MEVCFWYSVVAAHMSLRLVPKVLNAVDVAFLFDECFRMIDADVAELRDIQHIVVIGDWVHFYNIRRPHQALGIKTPAFRLAALLLHNPLVHYMILHNL